MRTITPELEALLRARFQAAGSGYAARLEVDAPVAEHYGDPYTGADWTQSGAYGATVIGYGDGTESNPSHATDGSTALASYGSGVYSGPTTHGFEIQLGEVVEVSGVTYAHNAGAGSGTLGGMYDQLEYSEDGVTWTAVVSPFGAADLSPTWDTPVGIAHYTWTPGSPVLARYFRIYLVVVGGGFHGGDNIVEFLLRAGSLVSAGTTTTVYQPKRINLNKNLRMGPDQAEVELANEALALGYGPTSIFPTNSRCRIYQWFGDPDNAVLTFTGVVDKVADNRDPLATALTCRSLAGAILVDQTFSTTAPQETGETGVVRTEANGVYLNREVDYIALDVITGAGWPSGDIDVADTSFVLDEFIREDGESGWDTLARLTAFVGYALWDDEDGTIHFGPLADQPGVGVPLDPDYAYEIGIGL